MNNAIQQLQMTDIDSRFRQTEFAINATAFEQGALNAEYKNRLEWIDDDNGLLLNICELNGVAINYEFFWAKLEGVNPGGMKDRPAMYMVERGRARGDLLPGARIVESTSGTLGLGLALAGVTVAAGKQPALHLDGQV